MWCHTLAFCTSTKIFVLSFAASVSVLPKLSPAQVTKLRHLTIVSLTAKSKVTSLILRSSSYLLCFDMWWSTFSSLFALLWCHNVFMTWHHNYDFIPSTETSNVRNKNESLIFQFISYDVLLQELGISNLRELEVCYDWVTSFAMFTSHVHVVD